MKNACLLSISSIQLELLVAVEERETMYYSLLLFQQSAEIQIFLLMHILSAGNWFIMFYTKLKPVYDQ